MCEWGKCKTESKFCVETRREVAVPIVPGRPSPPRTRLKMESCGRHLRCVAQHLNDRQAFIGKNILMDAQNGVIVKVRDGNDWR